MLVRSHLKPSSKLKASRGLIREVCSAYLFNMGGSLSAKLELFQILLCKCVIECVVSHTIAAHQYYGTSEHSTRAAMRTVDTVHKYITFHFGHFERSSCACQLLTSLPKLLPSSSS